MASQGTLQNIDYSRRSTVDWAGLTDKLGATVSKIGTDREKAREEIESQYTDTLTKLNKPLNLEKQSLTNFVLDGSDQYKKMALDLKKKLYNKEISSADYKKTLSNAQEHWMNFSEQAKTADDRFKLYQDRNTPNADGVVEASDGESFYMDEYLKMADLNNKKMVLGKDGSMYLQQMDESGNPVGELIDYRDFARPENMQINRVDVNSLVDGAIGNWKSVDEWTMLGRGGEKTISSIKNQPDYKLMKINVANAATANPKSALSILVDNGGVSSANYYSSDSQKKSMLSEAISKSTAEYEAAGKKFTDDDKKALELSFIKFEKNSAGEMIPALTNDQLSLAKEIVNKSIDMQIETKIQANAPAPYTPSTAVVGNVTGPNYSRYKAIKDAWETGDMGILSNMNPKYRFRRVEGSDAIQVFSINEIPGEKKGDPSTYQEVPVGTANEAKTLASYFYPSTAKLSPEELFETERIQFRADNPNSNQDNKPKKFN